MNFKAWSDQQEDECNQAADDVRAVEAGGHVEHRTVGARASVVPVLDEVEVLAALAGDARRPSRKVMTYQRRRPKTSPRSAANTPIWQVIDEATRTSVTGTARARLSSVGSGGQPDEGVGSRRSTSRTNRRRT